MQHFAEHTYAGHILTTEGQPPSRSQLVLDVLSVQSQCAYVQIDRRLSGAFNTANIVLDRKQIEAHRDACDAMLKQFDQQEGEVLANGA